MFDTDQTWTWVAALTGVVLGFGLSELSSFIKQKLHIGRRKRALVKECESIIAQIPQLRDIFVQCIGHLQQKALLPSPHVRAITVIYYSTLSELAPYLTNTELNLLHVAYERMRVGDEILESYDSDVRKDLLEGVITNPWKAVIIEMKEQIESYRVVEELLKSFIEGKPKDVFYLA